MYPGVQSSSHGGLCEWVEVSCDNWRMAEEAKGLTFQMRLP
jgi:hypothetical protein